MTKITVRRQRRKNMMIRPVPGGLEVFIPHWLAKNDPQVSRFIAEGQRKLAAYIKPPPPEQTSEANLRAMLVKWASVMGVVPARVQVRQMVRKWGSCSSRGNITLNRALCWVPPHLAEYVVVHELAHLLEMNHGPGFQAVMARHMPDWRERQSELNTSYSTFGDCA